VTSDECPLVANLNTNVIKLRPRAKSVDIAPHCAMLSTAQTERKVEVMFNAYGAPAGATTRPLREQSHRRGRAPSLSRGGIVRGSHPHAGKNRGPKRNPGKRSYTPKEGSSLSKVL